MSAANFTGKALVSALTSRHSDRSEVTFEHLCRRRATEESRSIAYPQICGPTWPDGHYEADEWSSAKLC